MLGDRFAGFRGKSIIAWETHCSQRVGAQPDAVVIARRHNGRPGGGTQGGGMEIIETQAVGRQCVDVRCFHQPAETAQVTETGIVE